MAAPLTVPQVPASLNSDSEGTQPLRPRRGVVTLFGYGITVRVDRGHLIVEDGIGTARRSARFARIGHDLERLIVIGSDGVISFAALRWLADQRAAFIMLERDGTVLATTGPVRSSDARLRRAQACAPESGAALAIVQRLMSQKLIEQERVARDLLGNSSVAETIATVREALTTADTVTALRYAESRAAFAYWSAWRDLPVTFPQYDLRRLPAHWRTFGKRHSPLSGSPRLACNPPNAILNYLYALLESEARLAAAALGLDPGMGVLHVDTDVRDSFACDLMEPIRPQVDAYLANWLRREPLRREWFFEQRNGSCRLMGDFAARLSETLPVWRRAVAPVAEWIAGMLWSTVTKSNRRLATRLTQRHKREARGQTADPIEIPPPPPHVCKGCGVPLESDSTYCVDCGVTSSTARLIEVAKQGRMKALGPEARARRAETQRRQRLAGRAWNPCDQPAWLTERIYVEQIQPRLAEITGARLSSALSVSRGYAVDIRAGRYRPHPRHWLTLAQLVRLRTSSASVAEESG